MRADDGGKRGSGGRSSSGDEDGGPDRVFGRRGGGKLILALALALVLILFVTANTESVRIHFLLFTASVPLIWALVGAALLGLALGLLLGRPGRRRRRRKGR